MTTKLAPEAYLEFWREAAAQEIGLYITCASEDDQRLLVNALYDCRKTFGGFDEMIVFQPKPAGTIYIMHKSAELP